MSRDTLSLAGAGAVFIKEIRDALRDRRTLMTVLLSSVLMGPLVLVLLSSLVATLEERAEQRVAVVAGIEHAPSLRNFIERQGFRIEPAPAEHEARLRDSRLGEPVLEVAPGFEDELLRGEPPIVTIVSDSGNRQAEAGTGRLARLLDGYNRERAALTLAVRGVPASLLQTVDIEERDLASRRGRSAQFTAMLPFFVIMAVLYGALNAALDTTAGERERGSLEPLLMNPSERWVLVVGKWGAVASVGMLIAVLSCLSFLPGQWLLHSEALAAMFRFGIVEALAFMALLAPLAGALAAVLMAIAIRCKSFKEAQANTTVLLLGVSLLPLVTVFNQEGTSPWHLWVPALAQTTLMGRVLKGEALAWADVATASGVCVLLTALGVAYVSKTLRSAALK